MINELVCTFLKVQGSKLLLKHPKDSSTTVNPDVLIENMTELLAASQSFMRTKMVFKILYMKYLHTHGIAACHHTQYRREHAIV